MFDLRPAVHEDASAILHIVRAAAADDETLPFRVISEDMCRAHWFSAHASWVAADDDGTIVGIYKLGENYPDRGSHVASATYIVPAGARKRGIGRALVEHSLAEARRRGFSAMQFNYVVSTNRAAVTLYEALGFSIVGRIPGAFEHRTDGFVDVYVMHRVL